MKKSHQFHAAGITLCLTICVAGIAGAQQTGFTRVMLQDHDLSLAGQHVVQARAEFQPGVASGRHTHPGEEAAYVLEGQVEVAIEGKSLSTPAK